MWAAASLNYFGVGRDGKTAYERLKGKAFKLPMAEFGELVHYKFQSKKWKKRGKMNAKAMTPTDKTRKNEQVTIQIQ